MLVCTLCVCVTQREREVGRETLAFEGQPECNPIKTTMHISKEKPITCIVNAH